MKSNKKFTPFIIIIVGILLIVCCSASVLAGFSKIMPIQIDGSAMEPAVKSGELWMIKKGGEPQIEKIMIYRDIVESELLVHRVIAGPGDKVKIENCKVYVNEEILKEDYVVGNICTQAGSFIIEGQEYTIPEGRYLVLGDNRNSSRDSRFTGFIEAKRFVGEIWFKYK